MGKSRHSVYLDDDLCKRAIELGINISRTCMNALREAVERMEQKETQK